MSLSSSLRSVKIRDNIIDVGRWTLLSSPVSFTYDISMQVGADAVINGNTLSGSISLTSDILSIVSAACIVQNNIFIRGSNTINSYINVSGSDEQIITNNIFDQSSLNGLDEDLVKNLPAKSVYTQNKNQSGYVAVPLFELANRFYPGSIAATLDKQNAQSTFFKVDDLYGLGHYLKITVDGDNEPYSYFTKINVNKYVPHGAKLLTVKTGISSSGTGAYGTPGGGGGGSEYDGDIADVFDQGYYISARVYDTRTNFGVNTGSVFDPLIEDGMIIAESAREGFPLSADGYYTQLRSTPQYLTLDLSADDFINTTDRDIVLRWQFSVLLGTGLEVFKVSPLTIKYQW